MTGSKSDSASRVGHTAATGPGGGKASSWGTWKGNMGLYSESAASHWQGPVGRSPRWSLPIMISRFGGPGLRIVSHDLPANYGTDRQAG